MFIVIGNMHYVHGPGQLMIQIVYTPWPCLLAQSHFGRAVFLLQAAIQSYHQSVLILLCWPALGRGRGRLNPPIIFIVIGNTYGNWQACYKKGGRPGYLYDKGLGHVLGGGDLVLNELNAELPVRRDDYHDSKIQIYHYNRRGNS